MSSDIIIYQTEDGKTKIQTRLENETVWLTQEQISELFQRDRSVITKHIGNIFKEVNWAKKAMCKICTLVVLTVRLSSTISMLSFLWVTPKIMWQYLLSS